MASPRSAASGAAQNYMKLSVAHEMTRNNTLNKVHVLATEIPQLLSQNRPTNVFGEATVHSRSQTSCAAIKLSEKNKLLEVEGTRAPVPDSWQHVFNEFDYNGHERSFSLPYTRTNRAMIRSTAGGRVGRGVSIRA